MAAGVGINLKGRKIMAIPGAPMKNYVRGPVRFDCENGQCGTCESIVNGRRMRLCKMAVPLSLGNLPTLCVPHGATPAHPETVTMQQTSAPPALLMHAPARMLGSGWPCS